MAKFFIVAALLALATQAFAAPADEVTEVARTTYLCANAAGALLAGHAADPITESGGNCRKLKPGQACIF
ncbi:hypothetical protein D9619_006620 [Psilocybe cf. subviscida]|uniref:Uncharacterized protein n=1 Tax=Psilocybe cf. subviscida TaxID=2480587 RepID=A0A8H5EXD8_9AGAR|nr:hypothetical protein D9619_006620 [Psilocybe cf. subviscida]